MQFHDPHRQKAGWEASQAVSQAGLPNTETQEQKGEKRLSKVCHLRVNQTCLGFLRCPDVFHCCPLWVQYKCACHLGGDYLSDSSDFFLTGVLPPAQPPSWCSHFPVLWPQAVPAAGMLFLLLPSSSKIPVALLPLHHYLPRQHPYLWASHYPHSPPAIHNKHCNKSGPSRRLTIWVKFWQMSEGLHCHFSWGEEILRCYGSMLSLFQP